MNPADQRVSELVDKWVTSIELHLKYATLTDEAYWQAQPWPRHQRPARWILELAQTRALDLKRQLAARIAAADAGFAEALELMAFLANLIGVQNIERFIPLAEPERENAQVLGQTQSQLQPLGATSTQTRALVEPTREMPMPTVAPERRAAGSAAPAGAAATVPAGTRAPATPAAAPLPAKARVAATPVTPTGGAAATPVTPTAGTAAPAPAKPAPRREPRTAARGSGSKAAPPPPPAPGSVEAMIIADAERLLAWGREWHELAEAIARMADRPGVVLVRKVLRLYKATIERAAQP